MSPANVDERTFDYLYEKKFPFVLGGPALYKYPLNYVSVDNIEGAKIAVEHLIKLNHKRIAYVTNVNSYFNKLRYEGYKKAILYNGFELDESICFRGDPYENVKKMQKMGQEKPTAIFAFNDYTALSYMEALEVNGIKVPDDMAIVGFDNIRMASFYSIALTTIDNRQHEFGKLAVNILLENINSDTDKTQQIIKKPELIIRRSCGSK
jgi:LacI family repressor for deo operon, udp, cdd, tsx, nupC, and nupG